MHETRAVGCGGWGPSPDAVLALALACLKPVPTACTHEQRTDTDGILSTVWRWPDNRQGPEDGTLKCSNALPPHLEPHKWVCKHYQNKIVAPSSPHPKIPTPLFASSGGAFWWAPTSGSHIYTWRSGETSGRKPEYPDFVAGRGWRDGKDGKFRSECYLFKSCSLLS